jgi:cytoskeleton protein RodZ
VSEEIQEMPSENVPPAPPPGALLAATREAQGISVADVARSLRLSVRQVEAIEADDYDRLPGKTFVRGFVRNYAKLLQIDPEPLLQAPQLAAGADSQPKVISVPVSQVELNASRSQRRFTSAQPPSALKYALVGVIVVAMVAWLAFELFFDNEVTTVVVKPAGDSEGVALSLPPAASEAPPAVAQSSVFPDTLPAAEAPQAPATEQAIEAGAALPGGARVRLVFGGESWIDLRDKSGRSIYKQTGLAGNEQIISGAAPFSLTVGKASNVTVFFNDKPVDLTPHSTGDVARLTLD